MTATPPPPKPAGTDPAPGTSGHTPASPPPADPDDPDSPMDDGAAAGRLRSERRGWYAYDWADSVFSTTVVTVFLGPYLSDVAATAAGGDRGTLHPLGIPVAAGSVFPYVVSLSVLLQVVLLPVLGAVADRTGRRRALLGGFGYLGALATCGLFAVAGGRYLLGAGLFLIANLAFGAAGTVYYSWLPDLAVPDERDAVSSRGWAAGYLGGGLLLALDLALFLGRDTFGVSEGDAVRICLLSAGLWWAAFTVPALRRLRDRPAGTDPAGTDPGTDPAAAARRRRPLAGGLRQLRGTLAEARRYPVTLLFLVAFLLYNDGVQTVIALAATYGDRELGLPQTVLIGTILLVQFVAFGGALLLGRIAALLGAKRTVLVSLAVWVLVLLAAFGLHRGSAAEFYALGLVLGVVLGGSQALSRSLFSQLVPHGREAEYFGLYQVSDKGTSWLGTFAFGLALQLTGSYRIAIVSLVVFFVAGGVLLAGVDVRRGAVEVGNRPPTLG